MSTSSVDSQCPTTSAEDARPACQPLNLTDVMILRAAQGQATEAHPWNGTWEQVHVWFDGRADVDALRGVLAQLGRLYPVVTSRLAEPDSAAPYWRYRPEASCVLHITELDSDDDRAAVAYVERKLTRPVDFDNEDPVSFHLVRLRSSRDLFVFKFDHVVMDAKSMGLLLQELNRLYQEGPAAQAISDEIGRDVTAPLTKQQRRKVIRRIFRQWWRYGNRPAVRLARPADPAQDEQAYRIVLRRVDAAHTQRWKERTRELAGFPCYSISLIASIFRSLQRHALPVPPDTLFSIDLGLTLRDPEAAGPIFCNCATLTRLRATAGDLQDRGALIRQLNQQLREFVKLGSNPWQVLSFARRRNNRGFRWWLFRLLLRRMTATYRKSFSLRYGLLHEFFKDDQLCGARVDHLYALGRCSAEQGLSLFVSEYRGALDIAAVYMPAVVPDAVAHAFLETLADDLVK
jgi:NRPS condensation-like uncharacterized protein